MSQTWTAYRRRELSFNLIRNFQNWVIKLDSGVNAQQNQVARIK